MATAQVCPQSHQLVKESAAPETCADCKRKSTAFMRCTPCKYVRCMNCVRGVKPLGSSTPAPTPSYSAPTPAPAPAPAVSDDDLNALLAKLSADPGVIAYEAEQKAKAAAAAKPAVAPTPAPSATSALPADWVECKTPVGKIFYKNTKTNATVWEKPTGTSAGTSTGTSNSTSTYSSTSTSTPKPTYVAPANPSVAPFTKPNGEVDLDALLASLDAPTPAQASAPTPVASIPQNSAASGIHKITIVNQKHVSRWGYDDGEISIKVTGGQPYYWFKWEPFCNGGSNGEGTADATRLSAGKYTVTIEDDGGNVTTQTFVITEPPKPVDAPTYDDSDDDDDDDDYSYSSRSSSGGSSARAAKPAKAEKPKTRTCPHCHGSGRKACGRNNCTSKCSHCGGARKVTCSVCKGKGEIRN